MRNPALARSARDLRSSVAPYRPSNTQALLLSFCRLAAPILHLVLKVNFILLAAFVALIDAVVWKR